MKGWSPSRLHRLKNHFKPSNGTLSSVNQGFIEKSEGDENAEPDSRYWSRDAEQIVNESSLMQEVEDCIGSGSESNECIVDIGDEEMTVE